MARRNKEEKIDIPLRADVIQSFVSMCLTDNQNILFRDFISLKNLVGRCNTESINMNINGIASAYYFEFLEFFLDERVTKKISNKKFILGKMLDESANKEVYGRIVDMTEELSNDDLQLTREFINDRIRYIYLYEGMEDIENLMVDLRTNNFNSLEELSERYETTIKSHFSILNMTKSNRNEILNNISLNEDGTKTLAEDLHATLNTRGNELSVGIEELDARVPLVMGELTLLGAPTGGFKSGTMLNMAVNCKLYNPVVECRDPTKKPVIIYLSMENTQKLTFSRAVKLIINMNRSEIKDTDPEVVASRLYRTLNGNPTSCKEMEIKFKYRESNQINVADIDGIIDEEEQAGGEVKAIFVDYIKGLKPEEHSRGRELRMQMADSSRALADLAIRRECAVVSAFQLNRGAIEATTLNAVHIQEAFAIIDHADNVVFLRRVYSPDHQRRFLQLFEGKMRSQEGDIGMVNESVMIPFDEKNSFRIIPTKFETNPFRGQPVNISLPNSSGQNQPSRGSTRQNNQGEPLRPPPLFNPPRIEGGKLLHGNETVFSR